MEVGGEDPRDQRHVVLPVVDNVIALGRPRVLGDDLLVTHDDDALRIQRHADPVTRKGAGHRVAIARRRHQASTRYSRRCFDVAIKRRRHRHQMRYLVLQRLGDAYARKVRMRCAAPLDALRGQPNVEFGEAGKALLLRPLPDAAASVLHALLDTALFPTRRHIAEVRVDQIVRRHGGKSCVDDPRLAAARHPIHCRLHVVVDAASSDAPQPGQAAQVRIEQHLVTLCRVGHQPECPRCAQLHVRQLHLAPHAANDDAFLAPVKLERLAPLEAQRHKGRACRHRAGLSAPGADRLRDSAIAAGKTLRLQLSKQSQRRSSLLSGPTGINLKRLLQPISMAIKLLRARLAPVAHLAAGRLLQPRLDRIPRQTRPSGDLANRQPLAEPHPSHLCVR